MVLIFFICNNVAASCGLLAIAKCS